jgi:hypothetical protein
MRCPLCAYSGPRGSVHAHLAGEHPGAVEMWTEASSGRMRYRVACPHCGEAHEARVKPRSQDPRFLEEYAREIRLVAFDMLLLHVEAEHEAAPAPGGEGVAGSLPLAGPSGGRGRPGLPGVPLPPGMEEPEVPAWAERPEPTVIPVRPGSET